MSTERIPLNTFAIGFGLAGLAETWTTAGESLGWWPVVGQLFWALAAIAWVWLVVAHLVRGARSGVRLAEQLRHPAQGPIAALVPVTGMLLAGDILTFDRALGIVLYLVFLTAAAVFAGWILGYWMRGGLSIDAVHGGYLLPTVAAGLVGADVAGHAGFALLGWALFGIGVFFWAIMTLLVVARLAFRPALPDPLVPTIAILLAPPGVAGVALFSIAGPTLSAGAAAIAGLGILLVVVQLALLPRYSRLRFTLGFWSFTFPSAAVLVAAMLWLRLLAVPGWQAITVGLLVIATALIGGIGIRSIVAVLPERRERAAEEVLTAADDAVEDAASVASVSAREVVAAGGSRV